MKKALIPEVKFIIGSKASKKLSSGGERRGKIRSHTEKTLTKGKEGKRKKGGPNHPNLTPGLTAFKSKYNREGKTSNDRDRAQRSLNAAS